MTAEQEARLAGIASKVPEIRAGDVWHECLTGKGGRTLHVLGFEEIEGFPWPMVTYKYQVAFNTFLVDKQGAPAFMFARLIKRGEGVSWKKATKQ